MGEDQNEKRKRREMLPALLDYYSDIGVGHATLFVAFVFGLFTVLSLLGASNSAGFILLSIVYWVLWAGGLHELMKFYYYLKVSSKILYDLGAYTLRTEGGESTYELYPLKEESQVPRIARRFFRILFFTYSKQLKRWRWSSFALIYFLIAFFAYASRTPCLSSMMEGLSSFILS